MFTGIITDLGEIVRLERREGADLRARIKTRQPLSGLVIGASIACSGVCLTVIAFEGHWFDVEISGETLDRTASANWAEGGRLNLERALKVGDELGGHIVTGHVDGVGVVEQVTPFEGSLRLSILVPPVLAGSIAGKGSVTVDGVSLTVNMVEDLPDGACRMQLNLIPHTAQHTTLGRVQPGSEVNLEIDVLARYLARMLHVQGQKYSSM